MTAYSTGRADFRGESVGADRPRRRGNDRGNVCGRRLFFGAVRRKGRRYFRLFRGRKRPALSMMKNAAKKVFLCDSTKFGQALRLSPLFGGGRGLYRHRPRHPQLFRAAAFSSRNLCLSAGFLCFSANRTEACARFFERRGWAALFSGKSQKSSNGRCKNAPRKLKFLRA